MVITILDYRDKRKEVDVGGIDKIKKMTVEVGSGDEVLYVERNDGSIEKIDSSDDRTRWFYDGVYTIFDREREINILKDPEWKERDHYSYLRKHGDCSGADMSDWW